MAAALAPLPPQQETSNPAGALGHGLSHGLLIAHWMGNNGTTGFKVTFPLSSLGTIVMWGISGSARVSD